MDLTSKMYVTEEMSRDKGRLERELETTRAAFGRGERVIYDFAECICTGYTALMRVKTLSYRDPPNAVFGDSQPCREYLGRVPCAIWGGWIVFAYLERGPG